MPARDPLVRKTSATLAAVERHHPDADTTKIRTELKYAKTADYIKRVVDAAPPLSAEQRSRLALLLQPVRATLSRTPDGREAAA